MLLSDHSVRRMLGWGQLSIEPRPQDIRFQPASVDLLLGTVNGVKENYRRDVYALQPGEFALGCTYESVSLPANVAGRVEGKSTLGRLGLMVECAGFIDPGFHGQVTLELKNLHHSEPILLPIGMAVCQISFYQMDSRADRPYGHPGLHSHYQGQTGPTPARQ